MATNRQWRQPQGMARPWLASGSTGQLHQPCLTAASSLTSTAYTARSSLRREKPSRTARRKSQQCPGLSRRPGAQRPEPHAATGLLSHLRDGNRRPAETHHQPQRPRYSAAHRPDPGGRMACGSKAQNSLWNAWTLSPKPNCYSPKRSANCATPWCKLVRIPPSGQCALRRGARAKQLHRAGKSLGQ